ncbi:MAG: HAMP domain-containing histidine kinase [Breznakibacter sp.]|nr:HAMP domain-containing histidine kinase [Breznakibacter sp.]
MAINSPRQRKVLALSTFAALVLLLGVHVHWLFKAATLEERLFNQRVAIALKEARDEIGVRLGRCHHMNDYLCGKKCAHEVERDKTAELDSILRSKLEINNIFLRYSFSVSDNHLEAGQSKKCFRQSLNGLIAAEGIRLNLEFPDRSRYVLAQIGGLFALSIFFIFFIGFSFLIMLRLYRREKLTMHRSIAFVNNMVHEFQTPLANIRLAVALLKKRIEGNAKQEEYLQVIQKEHHKLQRHVEEILHVSALGYLPSGSEVVDLYSLTNDVFENYQPSISVLNGKVNFHCQEGNYCVIGNYKQFEIVWNNLIDNAIKYSINGPEIDLHLYKSKGNICFSVEDQGIGIRKDELHNIFKQYYRVESGDVHNVKGFGLGLFYVRQILDLYHGKVSVESAPGKGSRFTIEFNETECNEQ